MNTKISCDRSVLEYENNNIRIRNTWPGEPNTENRLDLYVRVSGNLENEDVTPVPTAYMVYGTY